MDDINIRLNGSNLIIYCILIYILCMIYIVEEYNVFARENGGVFMFVWNPGREAQRCSATDNVNPSSRR